MDRFIKKSGIYQNLEKRRWEYWLVLTDENKILVSWLCWTAPQEIFEQWKHSNVS
ncbi:hypothetical protein [Guptibacillus algicola]|uniref:hypothetical protein n=1 Tax=Guptibacillus algicola TaxID=225844 RepID=UPI001CD1F9F0|nr:hypothetical protein [Alkalihalobacillus algicola]MCA0985733.1 hypothetical protein [Alkalihalobacillus algicola]